jgi:hypothetical protein
VKPKHGGSPISVRRFRVRIARRYMRLIPRLVGFDGPVGRRQGKSKPAGSAKARCPNWDMRRFVSGTKTTLIAIAVLA